MDSLRAQLKQIMFAEKGEAIVYQWFAGFTKGSLWAHSVNFKGLKEF